MTDRRENWSRRAFVSGLTVVGTAGLLGLHPEPAAPEPPPETNKIKLPQTPAMCEAPQYVVRDLLRAEGFSAVEYVKIDIANPAAAGLLERQLASGAIDIGFNFAAPVVVQIDAGDPIALLAGVHSGCFELFGTDRVRAIRDLSPQAETGVRLNTRARLDALGMSPRRNASRTSSSLCASSRDRYGDQSSSASINSTSTSAAY